MTRTAQSMLALAVTYSLSLTAAAPPIGFVQASAEFRLNQSTAYGNGTLFDGTQVETLAVRSDLTLSNGGHLALSPNSKARIFKTYAVLASGAADVYAPGYTLKAGNLSISGSGAQVAVDSANTLRVGATSTPVEVRNSNNLLIARVFPGRALAFEEFGGQGGASGPVTITGTLIKKGNVYTILDKTSNVTYEVKGGDLSKMVGKNVKITGSLVPAANTSVPVVAAISTTVVAGAAGGGLSAAAIGGIVVAGASGTGLGIAAGVGAFSNASHR